jgi:SAM-dependent methyltransferase
MKLAGNILKLMKKVKYNKYFGFVRKIKYKYFGKYTRKYSGILSINKNDITFYRGGKDIKVIKNGNRIVYNNYRDWKLVQSRKGKKKDLLKLWEATKDKQIKTWNFAKISKNEKVLEVGFRDGYNLRYLQQKGVKIEGIEVNHDAVESAKNLGCKAFEEDIQIKTHYKGKTFDVISACDVLEHCFSPENALKEMWRILKDDGRIVIEAPFENEFKENLIDGHSALFHNEREFEALVDSCNLYIQKKDTSNRHRNLFILRKGCKNQ